MDHPNEFYADSSSPVTPVGRIYVKFGKPVERASQPASPVSLAATPKSGKKIQPVWIACGSLAALGVITVMCILVLGVAVWTEMIPLPDFLKATDITSPVIVSSQAAPPTESAVTEMPAAATEVTTEVPAEAPTEMAETEKPPTLAYQGVSLTADPALGTDITAENVQAVSGADLPPWELMPSHVKISFNDYPLQGKFHQPYILIFPLQEYYAVSPTSKETAERLKNFLAVKDPAAEDAIPLLPEWNAAQFFHAAVKYIDFKNGSGVRFLTMYGQAASPVNNDSLFYCFQGITSDGKYYISAVLPATHPSLPANGNDIPNGDYDAFSNGFPAYIKMTSEMLSGEPDPTFTPDLAALDEMLASLEVKP